MLFSQFAPLLVYLQFSFCFCLYSTPTIAQLSRLFWSFWLLSVFVQIVPDLGSGSGLGFGFGFGPGHGHGHRKRYSGIFQQFIALCYFAEQVFWSSGLAGCLPARLAVYVYESVFVSVSVSMLLWRSLLALKTGSQCLRNRDSTGDSTLCPILSTLGVLIFPETIT